MAYLPDKEPSIAVRFSPVKYTLKSQDSNQGSLFALPYRWSLAVATKSAVTVFDTQQATPLARVSQIHYIGLTDLSW